MGTLDRGDQARPIFPGQTGVSDTFNYIGYFLPIAAIVAVVELIFPISLWLYTFFAIKARIYRDDPRAADMAAQADTFSKIVGMKPVGVNGRAPHAYQRFRRPDERS